MCLVRSIIIYLFLSCLACAQTPGNFIQGQTLGAAQLNGAFAGKQDYPVPTQPFSTSNNSAANTAFVQTLTNSAITISSFGCVGDGVADDSACVQNAVNSAVSSKRPLRIDSGNVYRINTGLTTSGQLILLGGGGRGGEYTATCTSGLRIGAAATNLLTLTGVNASGSLISNLCVDVTGGVNHTGTAISVGPNAMSVVVEHSQINNACVSVAVSGAGTTQNKNANIFDTVILPRSNASCAGISTGSGSTGANTGDGYYHNITIFCSPAGSNAATGFLISDSGGDNFYGNNVFGCSFGTVIKPGANQQVLFSAFTSTVLGDFSANDDLLIDTGAVSGSIASLFFTQTWTSGDGHAEIGPNVLIQNTGGSGNVQGIHFVGHRSYNYTTTVDNFSIGGANVKFVEVLDSHICSGVVDTGSASGIHVLNTAAFTRISGNVIGACDVGGSFVNGITVDSGTSNFTITNNDISTGTTANTIALTTSGSTVAMVGLNNGVDNLLPSVASAATINLAASSIATITGSVAVTTISNPWGGRIIYMTTPTGLTFNTGGNICNSVVSAANNTVIGYWNGTCWALK